MKLLYCPKCHDVFNLEIGVGKTCSCKASGGFYHEDGLHAEYFGGISLGFENVSFLEAVQRQPKKGRGKKFTAFVIPQECETMIYVDRGETR